MTSPQPNLGFAQSLSAAEQLHRSGDLPRALEAYSALADAYPHEPEARFRLALVQAATGRLDLAQESLRQAIAICERPHYLYALGDVCEQLGQRLSAIEAWQRALVLQPAFPAAHARLGVVFTDENQLHAAIAAFLAAAAQAPADKRHWWNLGSTLARLGEDRRAVEALQEAVRLDPHDARASELLGTVLLRLGEVLAARNAFRDATRCDQGRSRAWLGLANCETHLGHTAEVIANLERAEALQPADAAQIGSQRLLALQYAQGQSLEAVFDAHRDWAQRYAPTRPAKPFSRAPDPDRRLRIGYLSPRFHDASVSFLSAPILTCHDRAAYDIFCYAEQVFEDDVTKRLRAASSGWRVTSGQSDEAVAHQIRADGIDILVDLAGHTPGHRLPVLAWRPAPVQGTWLDYFNTTGIEAVDFIVSDAVHSPPGDRQPFVERVVRLPTLRYCWEPPEYAPAVRTSAACLGAAPVFGSFNRLAKLSAATLDAWCVLLEQVPEARLLIKNSALGGEAERAYVQDRFVCRGIDPARLELRGSSSHAAMLTEYLDIDVALDTFPYNGGLTTLEALWMGRPVVTLRGETMIGRQSQAILSAIGLQELCGANMSAYVALASALVKDRPRLAALSAGLRQRMRASALMDVPGFTRSLEALYRQEWRRWCASPRPGVA